MSEYFSYFCIFLAGNHSQARGILDLTYFPTKARVLHETCRCNDKHYLLFVLLNIWIKIQNQNKIFLRLLCPLTFGSLSDALLPGSNWNFFIQTLFVGFCLRFILICWRFSGTVDSISVVGDVVSSAAVVIVVTRHTLWLLQLFPRRRTVLLRNSWKWIFIRTE